MDDRAAKNDRAGRHRGARGLRLVRRDPGPVRVSPRPAGHLEPAPVRAGHGRAPASGDTGRLGGLRPAGRRTGGRPRPPGPGTEPRVTKPLETGTLAAGPRRRQLLAEVADRVLAVTGAGGARVGVDGVDGAGKTTFAAELAAALRSR